MTKALFRPILQFVGGDPNIELVAVSDFTSYANPLDLPHSVHNRADGTVCFSNQRSPFTLFSSYPQNSRALSGFLVWYWCVSRGLLNFDTTIAPDPASITSAQIRIPLKYWSETNPPDATLHLVEGLQHIPAIPSDYGAELSAVTDLAVPIPFSPDGINFFILNPAGIAKINPGGQTRYCTRVQGDINSHDPGAPGGQNAVGIAGAYLDGRDLLTPQATSTASAVGHHGATLNLDPFQGLGLPQLEVVFVGAPLPFPRVYFTYWNTDDPATLYHTPYHLGLGMGDTIAEVVSGLLPGKIYAFRADIDLDGSTTVKGLVNFFITLYTPLTVVTDPATAITAYTATLNGQITDLGDSVFGDVSFAWGPFPGPFPYTAPAIPAHLVAPGLFAANLSGLTPGTTYGYYAIAQGDDSIVRNGATVVFSTPQIPAKRNKAYALGRYGL